MPTPNAARERISHFCIILGGSDIHMAPLSCLLPAASSRSCDGPWAPVLSVFGTHWQTRRTLHGTLHQASGQSRAEGVQSGCQRATPAACGKCPPGASTGAPGAAMEPCSSERGNVPRKIGMEPVQRASMEPRPSERGNNASLRQQRGADLLQWSHVLPNVET